MTAHHAKRYWSRLSVLGVLLILLSGSAGLFAQPASMPTSSAQVIAQGVDLLAGDLMRWDIQDLTLPDDSSSGVEVASAFVFVTAGQILLGNDGVGDQLISENQAGYVFWGDPQMAFANGDQPVVAQTIALVQSGSGDSAAVTPAFQIDAGRYNVQLTRGMLTGDQVDTFAPVNDLPYLVIPVSGTLMIDVDGADPGDGLSAGWWDQLNGEISLSAGEDSPASYLIASIGEQLPDLPPPPEEGDVSVRFWDCDASLNPVDATRECTPADEEVEFALTRFTEDNIPLTRTDYEKQPDGSWLLEDVFHGEWEFVLVQQDLVKLPEFSVLGDAEEQNDIWTLTVTAGKMNVFDVMLYTSADTTTGLLTVSFMECPDFWTPEEGFSPCWFATGEPNLTLSGVTYPDIQLSTQVDAQWVEDTVYSFESIPVGTYQLELDSMEGWDGGHTLFLHDAYFDGQAYNVDIEPETPHSVMIVRVVTEGDGPSDVATGYVVITQEVCEATQSDRVCEPDLAPWEVVLTNSATSKEYFSSSIGWESAPGIWYVEVPVGEYSVTVPGTGGMNVEATGWVTVSEGQESYVLVRTYP